ncbi:MAG: TolC family protein [Chitinophagaceae bacterium]
MHHKRFILSLLILLTSGGIHAQTLTLREAVAKGVANYETLKAKEAYARSSEASASAALREMFPNLVLSAQQDYGTVNGQNGPLYGFGGFAASSSGLPLQQQNWNAAFGALYLANFNWEVFAFGKARNRMESARAIANRDRLDWQQELFRHEIKVAGTYLNLLAAQKLVYSYEKNLLRADTFRRVVRAKALNGLVAGVDSSQANAEVSNARIALTKARDQEQEQANQLALLTGLPESGFLLDSSFLQKIPTGVLQTETVVTTHPVLQWYDSRVYQSKKQTDYLRSFYYPSLSFVSIYQTRASGFGNGYASNQNDYTHDYWTGVSPTRSNYLVGLGLNWNLTQPYRSTQQVKAQRLMTQGLQDEYDLAQRQLQLQSELAGKKMRFALDNYNEVNIQVKAASDAYQQKSVLYKNGLTNLVDLTQAMYTLIRAETERDIAYCNVWQALLLKAAASGDYTLFESQL